jgi:hypothetical protein
VSDRISHAWGTANGDALTRDSEHDDFHVAHDLIRSESKRISASTVLPTARDGGASRAKKPKTHGKPASGGGIAKFFRRDS